MNEQAQALARLIDSLARVVARLDEDQLRALLDGRFRIEVGGTTVEVGGDRPARRAARPRRDRGQLTPGIDVEEAERFLRACESVDEGRRYLDERFSTLADLRVLVRHLKLPGGRGDDAADLASKVLNRLIAQRLNRRAIRESDVAAPSADRSGVARPIRGDTPDAGGQAPPPPQP